MRNSQSSIIVFLIFCSSFFYGCKYSYCQINLHVKNNEYILSWRTLETPSKNWTFDDDTLAIWFEPLGSCSLKSVRLYNINYQGQLTLDIWKSTYKGHIVTTDSVNDLGKIGVWRGSNWNPGDVFKISPLSRHIWGTDSITITSSETNKWIEIPFSGEIPYIDGYSFIIGIYCKRESG